MDKKKKIIYSIVVILIVLGLVGLSFYLGTQINKFTDTPKENEQENSEKANNNKIDDEESQKEVNPDEEEKTKEEEKEVITKPEKNKNYTFFKEYEDEITLNNEKHTLLTYYYNDFNGSDSVVRKEVYLDNKTLIFDDKIIDQHSEMPSIKQTTLEEIDQYHKESAKYYIIKDTKNQKDYLILRNTKKILNGFSEGFDESITIINNNQILKQYKPNSPSTTIFIEAKPEAIGNRNYVLDNGKQILYRDSFVDIHDTYLYYVTYHDCKVDEYQVTIENGVIKESLSRNYYNGNEETEYGHTVLAGEAC